MMSDLRPTSEALVETARQHVAQQGADATEDVRVELSRAQTEAHRLVAQARMQGKDAAERIASLQLRDARREAREMVLEAQRRVFETLRHDAITALELRALTSEGRMLAERLSALVAQRLGGGARVDVAGSDLLVVEAQSGNRRVVIGPPMLVDQVLWSMTEEVENLWA